MSGHIVILTAIDTELNKARAPDGVEVIYTGVGKVNAASIATLAVMALQPKLVINYGTAGKIAHIHNGLVEVADVVQRDMAAMPLAPRGRTPFSPELDRLSSGFGNVVCGTGDSFVTATDPWLVENSIDIVDMELFAIAHVCARACRGARSSSSPTQPTTTPPITGTRMSPTARICSGMC